MLRTRDISTVNSKPDIPIPLNEKRLAIDVHSLASIDQDMARILENHGVPPLWDREPGFTTLIRIILEQQVSQTSADAMFRRLQYNIEPLTPVTVIAVGRLMALRRPDVWPVGDIALATAFKNLKGWSERPTQPELTEIAKAWSPYRATAARMLWNYYLNGMSR